MNQQAVDGILKDVTSTIVKNLVNNPEQVNVKITLEDDICIITLSTAPKDVGQVIGKNAHLISSIRSIVCAIGGRHGVEIHFNYSTDKEIRRSRTEAPGNSEDGNNSYRTKRTRN